MYIKTSWCTTPLLQISNDKPTVTDPICPCLKAVAENEASTSFKKINKILKS